MKAKYALLLVIAALFQFSFIVVNPPKEKYQWHELNLGEIENSPLYRLAVNNLPNYIFLEPKGNTEPWEHYTQITDPFEIPGAMWNNHRALYKKNLDVNG
jgi:hypothetical protein